MQAIQLIELAATVASYAEHFAAGKTAVSVASFDRYWRHAKSRTQRWMVAIAAASNHQQLRGDTAAFFYAMAEEILAADVLNRVWTGVGFSIESEPIAEKARSCLTSVSMGHAEVRKRLVAFLLSGRPDASLARRLERCRKLSECWTDLLLAFLPQEAAQPHAFDSKRVADFRRSMESPACRRDTLTRLLSNVKSPTIPFSEICPHENLNRLVAHSIVTGLGPDLLDSTGQFKDLWQIRLSLGTQDTLASVDVLLAEESGSRF